jgi:hypothetical protein
MGNFLNNSDAPNEPSDRGNESYVTSVQNTTGVCGYDSLLWMACFVPSMREKLYTWNKPLPTEVELVKRINDIILPKPYYPNNGSVRPTPEQLFTWRGLISNTIALYVWYRGGDNEEKKYIWRQQLTELIIKYTPNSQNTVLNNPETQKKFPIGKNFVQPNWAGRVYYYMMALKEGTDVTANDILSAQKKRFFFHKYKWDDLGSFADDILNFISVLFETSLYDYDYMTSPEDRLLPVLKFNEKVGRHDTGNVIVFVPIIHGKNVYRREWTHQSFIHEDPNSPQYFDNLIGIHGLTMIQESDNNNKTIWTPHAISWACLPADPNSREVRRRTKRWSKFNNGSVQANVRSSVIKAQYVTYLKNREVDESHLFIYKFNRATWLKLLDVNNLDDAGNPTLEGYVRNGRKILSVNNSCENNKKITLKF